MAVARLGCVVVCLHKARRGDKRELTARTPTSQGEKGEFVWRGVVATAKRRRNFSNFGKIPAL